MNLLNIFKRKEKRTAILTNRGNVLLGDFLPSGDQALQLSAVYAAVNILASSISTLPVHLKRRKDDITENATDHPLYRLLKVAPNPLMSPADFFSMVVTSLLLRGNSYVEIVRSAKTGQVVELVPIHPDRVTVKPSEDGRKLQYHVDSRKVPLAEVWHIRGLTHDGVNGVSAIEYAAMTLSRGLAADRHSSKVFQRGGRPGGILEVPEALSEDEQAQLSRDFDAAHGGGNAGTTAVLAAGMKYLPISVSLEDLQFIQIMQLTRQDVASIFSVPLHMLGDLSKTSYASQEQSTLDFLTYSLRPWITRIEQSFIRDVLFEHEQLSYFPKFNADALLRVDFKTRYDTYVARVQSGLLSPNEARILEDLTPRPGGDVYFEPLNMARVRYDENGNLQIDNQQELP